MCDRLNDELCVQDDCERRCLRWRGEGRECRRARRGKRMGERERVCVNVRGEEREMREEHGDGRKGAVL